VVNPLAIGSMAGDLLMIDVVPANKPRVDDSSLSRRDGSRTGVRSAARSDAGRPIASGLLRRGLLRREVIDGG
jgi:hypothetical protein